jgi:hypothetical protein
MQPFKTYASLYFFIGPLIAALCFFSPNRLFSQDNLTNPELANSDEATIKLEIGIMVDKLPVADSVMVTISNTTNGTETATMVKDKFVADLKYRSRYVITITKRDCSTKVIAFDTNCPHSEWSLAAQVTLTSKNKNIVNVGGLKYNPDLQTFVKYAKL